jgi:predicted phage gp36 major capsid-like protein
MEPDVRTVPMTAEQRLRGEDAFASMADAREAEAWYKKMMAGLEAYRAYVQKHVAHWGRRGQLIGMLDFLEKQAGQFGNDIARYRYAAERRRREADGQRRASRQTPAEPGGDPTPLSAWVSRVKEGQG